MAAIFSAEVLSSQRTLVCVKSAAEAHYGKRERKKKTENKQEGHSGTLVMGRKKKSIDNKARMVPIYLFKKGTETYFFLNK